MIFKIEIFYSKVLILKTYFSLSLILSFNTSFNLAGEPLVENLLDALDTLYRSKLKYLYLPELDVLVEKTIEDPKEKLIVEVEDEFGNYSTED